MFHVPCSKLTLRETDHSWFVPVVGSCTISDLKDCQFELFRIADDLEVDVLSFELIRDQEDAI